MWPCQLTFQRGITYRLTENLLTANARPARSSHSGCVSFTHLLSRPPRLPNEKMSTPEAMVAKPNHSKSRPGGQNCRPRSTDAFRGNQRHKARTPSGHRGNLCTRYAKGHTAATVSSSIHPLLISSSLFPPFFFDPTRTSSVPSLEV